LREVSTATPPPPPGQSSPSDPPPSAPPPAPMQPPAGAYYQVRSGTSGFAVAALVLGIAQLCTWPVSAVLAVIFGNVALDRIARSGGQLGGRGMAIAGIVLGWIGIAVAGAVATTWLVYGLANL